MIMRLLLAATGLGAAAFVAMAADRLADWPPPSGPLPDRNSWLNRFHSYGPDQDVRIVAPQGGWSKPVVVRGGRHVVVDGRGETASRLQFKAQTGSVSVSDIRIALAGEGDAIAVASRNGHSPDVTLENIVVTGVRGTREGIHSDIFQGQGDIGRLVIRKLVGESGYQGIFLKGTRDRAVGSVVLDRVALRHSGAGLGFLLWFGDGARKPGDVAAPRFPVYLKDVYVMPRPGEDLGRSIYPNRGVKDALGRDIGAYSTDGGRTWRWPAAANIHGVVISGPPPKGMFDFAK
jgi:hypothetical protein